MKIFSRSIFSHYVHGFSTKHSCSVKVVEVLFRPRPVLRRSANNFDRHFSVDFASINSFTHLSKYSFNSSSGFYRVFGRGLAHV